MIQPNFFRYDINLSFQEQIQKTDDVIKALYKRYRITSDVIDPKFLSIGETGYLTINPSTGGWFTLTNIASFNHLILTKINDNRRIIEAEGEAIVIAMNIANAMSNRD